MGFSKGAKRSPQAQSIALIKCSASGALEEVNEAAIKLFAG